MASLLIVVALFNEVGCVADVLRGLRRVSQDDIAVIDDGSTDGAVEAVEASGVRLPHLIRQRC